MPKNSRRKKVVRQRATQRGECYTRALRAARSTVTTADTQAGATAGSEVDAAAWERDLARIQAVQQLVEARGWVVALEARDELDDAGRAATMDVHWDYPAAFSASSIAGDELEDYLDDLDDDLAEDRPRGLGCSFSWDADTGLMVAVETAGNWRGCRHHRTVRHTLPMDDTTTSRLPQLLDAVESAARAVDPARLLACTLEGPCGGRARQRAAQRDRLLAWSSAMVEAGRKFSPEQMAELQAWEGEHLNRVMGPDGEPLGTSDWPGWVPLIGLPPWREAPATDDPDPDLLPIRSPDNDGVPVDLLRPALERRDISAGAVGLWSMLVSYYWCCKDDRTITQLHEHRPQDRAETDEFLAELVDVGMVTVSAAGVVTINPDHLGELAPTPT